MKVQGIIFLVAAASVASAFSPNVIQTRSTNRYVKLYGISRPDSSDDVAEAFRISKASGAGSKEAKVAWDAVEEKDSNDSSAAFTLGEMPHLPKEDPHRADYENDIKSLAYLLDETREKMSQTKVLARSLKELEISDPNLSDLGKGPDADAMRKALAEAKAACDAYGPNSAEADIAWDELDAACQHHAKAQSQHSSYRYSAAALKAHHYYNAVVDTQLLSDAIEAFDTIEALSRFVRVEKNRLGEDSAIKP